MLNGDQSPGATYCKWYRGPGITPYNTDFETVTNNDCSSGKYCPISYGFTSFDYGRYPEDSCASQCGGYYRIFDRIRL
jgi:hypothetical protein